MRAILNEANLAPLNTIENHYLILNMALSTEEPLTTTTISSILTEGL